jgi:CheY-like chemotaxis protein
MQHPTFSIEERREFKPFFRPRRKSTRDAQRSQPSMPMRLTALARLPFSEAAVVAPSGAADPSRHLDGRREIRGGSLPELGVAREGSFLYPHQAMFPGAPLPATAPPPATTDVPNRILIADDDALVRGSLAAVLELEGFVVDEAQNGVEAVSRAINHKPDLVLLDLNMPQWDGWTAFSQLDRVTPLLPVIVITARPNQYLKAVELGVDAFMEKPLNLPILMRAINRLTREDAHRHVRRITNRGFITQLLDDSDS